MKLAVSAGDQFVVAVKLAACFAVAVVVVESLVDVVDSLVVVVKLEVYAV